MQYDSDSLVNFGICLKRKQYDEIFKKATLVEKSDNQYVASQLFAIRALSEIGKVKTAYKKLTSIKNEFTDGYINPTLDLWEVFLQLFVTEATNFEEILVRIDELSIDGNNDVLALANYLKSRVISFGMAVGTLAQNRREEAAQFMLTSASHYIEAGNIMEYGSAAKEAAQLFITKINPRFDVAESILEPLLQIEEHPDQLYFETSVKLILQIIASTKARIPESAQNLKAVDHGFKDIKKSYQAAGYDFWEADVNYHYGLLLLDYADNDGMFLLRNAIKIYGGKNEIINRQIAWGKISAWYSSREYSEKVSEAQKEINHLHKQMELDMAQVIEVMEKIHHAFVSSEELEAERFAKLYLDQYAHTRMAPQIRTLLGNALIGKNQHLFALKCFEEAVGYYKPAHPNTFLSEAYFNYSNAIFNDDAVKGEELAIKAIDCAEQLQDFVSVGKYCRELGMHLTQQAIKHNNLIEISKINKCFDYSLQAFNCSNTFEAQQGKAQANQQRGISNFNFGKIDEALTSLQETAKFFLEKELKMQLAFILSYLGIVTHQKARNENNIQLLLNVASKYGHSSALFASLNASRYSWNAKYLQAQSIVEFAKGQNDKQIAEIYYAEAEELFKEAAIGIDYLKGLDELYKKKLDENIILPPEQPQELKLANIKNYNADYDKVFINAFRLNFFQRKNYGLAQQWVERNKSRQLQTRMWEAVNHDLNGIESVIIPSHQDLQVLLSTYSFRFPNLNMMLCEYYILDQHIILFLIKLGWAEPKQFILPIGKDEVFNAGNIFLQQIVSKTKRDDQLSWINLEALIVPILANSEPEDLLYIIPHGLLHQLPLHLIKAGNEPHLIARNPIAYLPGTAALMHLELKLDQKSLAYDQERAIAVFGDSRNNLAYAKKEAETISLKWSVNPLIGNEVNKKNLVSALEKADIIHFAGHGNAKSGIGLQQEIWLADNEILTAYELMNIKNHLELLVLSGCETGTNEIQPGTDELIGFPAAALFAGTSSVLTTLWKINDQSTQKFFKYFYEHLIMQKQSKVNALRYAMVRMMNDPTYTAFHWGAFTLTGSFQ